ncbi:penicillin-binding protein 1A [Thioalkalivibrio sp. HK1]|uniref:penicillin-binding protein 1A n=1 Tax=Thioalkalivibrio sp. HK1 TaxID=1469245 RepID=UPI00046EF499|nr:penicillin-binding protein 1A [Thioalkalivibrio sp. HK1]
MALLLLLIIAGGASWWYLDKHLPSPESLRGVQWQVPLQVYTRDGRLIGEFGEKRRTPLRRAEIPQRMIHAFIASEDDRFYQHPGVDWQGLVRAAAHLIRTGEKGPGGSTITMQVARNFFLGREKTYLRKINEILLALKIERLFTKDEILELYINKIFLGHRAYGAAAASLVYYGLPLSDLNLAQMAMIAGLPKAPSRFNPVTNPERAIARRDYVLGRMLDIGYISRSEHDKAQAEGVTAKVHALAAEVEAPYIAEMARAYMEERYGEEAYTAGYKVYTTIEGPLQSAANDALRNALLAYDLRHGYRGPEGRLATSISEADSEEEKEAPQSLSQSSNSSSAIIEEASANIPAPDPEDALRDDLGKIPVLGSLHPALVRKVDRDGIELSVRDIADPVRVSFADMEWARPYITPNRLGRKPKKAADVASLGDIVRLQKKDEGFVLSQVPAVEGALVSLSPKNGAILSLVGGFDFRRSKFNRATQAKRQPGSSFKPFIYSAALEAGFTAASIINDAPVVFDDPSLESAWRPENYSRKFFGPTRLRTALYKSRNLVSIRLLREMGIDHALEHLAKFGFDPDALPHGLSLALGSADLSPLEIASGYAVIANGGHIVIPHFVDRIVDIDDTTIFTSSAPTVCEPECEPGVVPAPRTLDERNAWLMYSLLRDVIRSGTARKALSLERSDIAGKTGTTNDQRDAWFSGFNADIVATAWVGFDEQASLGNKETGGRAALPMWIEFMETALADTAPSQLKRPDRIVTVRIDPATGMLAPTAQKDAIFESFRKDRVPSQMAEIPLQRPAGSTSDEAAPAPASVTERLF